MIDCHVFSGYCRQYILFFRTLFRMFLLVVLMVRCSVVYARRATKHLNITYCKHIIAKGWHTDTHNSNSHPFISLLMTLLLVRCYCCYCCGLHLSLSSSRWFILSFLRIYLWNETRWERAFWTSDFLHFIYHFQVSTNSVFNVSANELCSAPILMFTQNVLSSPRISMWFCFYMFFKILQNLGVERENIFYFS